MNKSTVKDATYRLTTTLFIIYLAILCWVVLLKLGVQFSYMKNREVNLTPFRELFLYHKADLAEIIMNVLIFIPAGIYTGVLFRERGTGKKMLFVFLLSLFIEGVQYILAIGAFDTTDIITNTIGGITGLMLCRGTERAFNDTKKAHRFINLIALIGTVLLVSLLVLLKLNMLPVRYQ